MMDNLEDHVIFIFGSLKIDATQSKRISYQFFKAELSQKLALIKHC